MKRFIVAVFFLCVLSGVFAEGKQEPPRANTMSGQKKLINETIEDFTSLLASKAPVPGGGSTAALEAALGISLISMVTAITEGRNEYAHRKAEFQQIAEEAENIHQTLLSLVDEDAAAYNGIVGLRSMPRDTEEQKHAYREAVQDALKTAAVTPYNILSAALGGLRLAKQLSQDYYVYTASDLGLAVQSLKTAAQGAELTILINLSSITDEAFIQKYGTESQAMLDETVLLADAIYAEVRTGLKR